MIFEGSILLPGGCELFVVNEAKRQRSSPPAVARRSLGQAGMVAQPGMVGILAVRACLLFAG
jgi:hypothetical protein